MKNSILKLMAVLFFTALFTGTLNAQNNNLGIGTGTPDSSAMLEILSSDKGLLVPRMTATERLAIPLPANALLVYDTDSACFLYYKLPTTTWINLCAEFAETDPEVGMNDTNSVPVWNGSQLISGSITDSAGNVGISNTTPISKLHINSIDNPLRIQTTRNSNSYLNWSPSGANGYDWDLRYSSNGLGLGSRLWFYFNDDQIFYTNNGTERMYIKSNGNIGIGKSAPTTKLDVNGVITATSGSSTDWNTAFNWGNHGSAGYLTSETDPIFGTSIAAGISIGDTANWQSAYGWGNHNTAGYVTETGANTLTNKTLRDNSTFFQDNGDTSKKLQFELSGITTATTRTITVPDTDMTLVGTAVTQTLTNKTWGDNLDMNSQKIINLATPIASTDAVTKAYVDGVASTLHVKISVLLATTADLDDNGSISGTIVYNSTAGSSSRGQITATLTSSDQFTIDGINLSGSDDGSRILLKDQSSAVQNGIWTTTISGVSLTLNRATDFDQDSEVTSGAFTFITEGNTYANNGFVLTTSDPIIIGGASGTPLLFSQFSGAGQITAGSGLTKSGNLINAIGSTTIIANANSLEVNSSATPNQILLSSGSVGTSSTFGALPLADTDAVTGVLGIANGGSNATSFTAGSRIISTNSGNTALEATSIDPANIVLLTGTQTLTNKSLADNTTYFIDESDNTKQLQFQLSGITTATTRTLTVPDANMTLVGTDVTQTLTNKTLASPKVLSGLYDTNGNELIKFSSSVGSVNEITITTVGTGIGPIISSTGGENNIDLRITPKGSGKLILDGLSWPNADGAANQVMKTDGAGSLSFVDVPILFVDGTTTTNATQTTISTITTSTDAVYYIETRLVARRTDSGTEGAGFKLTGIFRNDGGTLTKIGEDNVFAREAGNIWHTDLAVSGTNIIVRVRGEAAKTINWNAVTEIITTN